MKIVQQFIKFREGERIVVRCVDKTVANRNEGAQFPEERAVGFFERNDLAAFAEGLRACAQLAQGCRLQYQLTGFLVFLAMIEIDFLVFVLAMVIGVFAIFEFHVEIWHFDAEDATEPLSEAGHDFTIDDLDDEKRFRGVVHFMVAWILWEPAEEFMVVHR